MAQTQTILLKDLPTIPRSKVEITKAGESLITALVLEAAGSPFSMEWTGADTGTGKVTLKLKSISGVQGDWTSPSKITVNAFGQITKIESGSGGAPSLDWSDIKNKPLYYTPEKNATLAIINEWWRTQPGPMDDVDNRIAAVLNNWQTNNLDQAITAWWNRHHSELSLDWSQISNKPDVFNVSVTWEHVQNKPTTLTGFGLKTEVDQLIAEGVRGIRREEHFYTEVPPVDSGLVYARLFAVPARLNTSNVKLAYALTAPTAPTTFDFYRNLTKFGSVTFDTTGKATFAVDSSVDFDRGDMLRVIAAGAANGIGRVAVTLELSFYAGDPNYAGGWAGEPLPPEVFPTPNNVQHQIASVDNNFVWLYSPTSLSTVSLTSSLAYALKAPTAQANFTLIKNGEQVGTLTFAANSKTGVYTGADLSLDLGDVLAVSCVAANGLGGMLLSVNTTPSAPDNVNLLAATAPHVTADEFYRYVASNDLTLLPLKSTATAAQSDATKATTLNLRRNNAIIGTVTFPAGANDGTLHLTATSVSAGDIVTVDGAAATALAGVVVNLAATVPGSDLPLFEFSGSYVGDAPTNQMVNGLLVSAAKTLDFAHAIARLSQPAAAAFEVVIQKNGTDIAVVAFAAGAKLGVFSTEAQVPVAVGDRVVAYVKSGTATRPAITVPMV